MPRPVGVGPASSVAVPQVRAGGSLATTTSSGLLLQEEDIHDQLDELEQRMMNKVTDLEQKCESIMASILEVLGAHAPATPPSPPLPMGAKAKGKEREVQRERWGKEGHKGVRGRGAPPPKEEKVPREGQRPAIGQ